jgi:ABC-type branched-subunit amino acid transport system permease subunit
MKILRTTGLLALLAFLLVFPLLFSDAVVMTITIFTFILMTAATGWNLFSGYTRYLSLGHATFYGLGAYILAGVCQIWHVEGGFAPLLLLPLIGLITALCSLPLGWVALQTRRSTFMVITIALFSLVSLLPTFLPQATTIYLPVPPWMGVFFNIPFYYTALLLLLGALAASWWIRSSKFGLCLLAIGNDEDRAQGLGNKTAHYKLIAWTISALFVGVAGALNAYYLGLLDPASAFDPAINVALPVTAFIGGIGTLTGPLLGALFTVPLQQYLTLQYGNEQGLDLILYGVLLLVVVLVLPQGVGPALQKRFLTGMAFSKKESRNPVPVLSLEKSGAPSLAFSHEPTTDTIASLWTPDSVVRSTNSLPLSMKRGYESMKASRLIPLVVDSSQQNKPAR